VKARTLDIALRGALARVLPVAAGAPLEVRPLTGGLNRRSFVVTAGERQVVVRLPQSGAPPLLDVAAEAEILRTAASAGLAPAVVHADATTGLLVTEYRANAAAWTAAAAREPRNIARLTATLRQLHALPAAAPRFTAGAIAERYVEAVAHSARPADARWSTELVRRAHAFDARDSANALCHNDLFAANVLDDGALVLVDFEYAARAAPLLDLASFAGMNGLSAEQRVLLWSEYYRRPPSPTELDALGETVRLVRLLAYFWSLLGSRRAAQSPNAYDELGASLAQLLHEDP
jgi:thiamine kinase-like enzyme